MKINLEKEEYLKMIEHTLDGIKGKFLKKGEEYQRNNDVFHNFNEGAKKTGLTPMEVLKGFRLKHDISVDDIIEDIKKNHDVKEETIHEKLDDILIYTIILKTMLLTISKEQ